MGLSVSQEDERKRGGEREERKLAKASMRRKATIDSDRD